MSFRQIIVKQANYLSFEEKNVKVTYEEGDKETLKIPLEDVALIVIENNQSIISLNLINQCMGNNIVIITCNDKKLPQGIIKPFSNHYRQLENIYKQLEYTDTQKKILWKEIIKQKINNQINVLKLTNGEEKIIEKMIKYKLLIKRNDITNREAVCAKLFFEEMYGNEFKRFIDDKINATLNYGYSILVSSIVRQLVSYGIDPRFGIWHSSKSNSLNLAYDLVEPFRPIVDYYIKSKYEFISDDLTPKVRRELVALLNAKVECQNKEYRLQNAIELFVKQYLLILRGEEKDLLEINIIPIKFYEV